VEHIRINHTDIILQEFGDGKGKIIISDDEYGYDFSYYWGAMGKDRTLKDFIKSINSDYFVNKLSHNIKGPLNSRKTFRALRKYIQECFKYELQWYDHVEFQKDFRRRLKDFQRNVTCDMEFVQEVQEFHNKLDYFLIKDNREMERVEKLFKDIFAYCEPWYFLDFDTHPEEIFLEKLHIKLKEKLSNPVQLCLF
jgi:hypothetical protein